MDCTFFLYHVTLWGKNIQFNRLLRWQVFIWRSFAGKFKCMSVVIYSMSLPGSKPQFPRGDEYNSLSFSLRIIHLSAPVVFVRRSNWNINVSFPRFPQSATVTAKAKSEADLMSSCCRGSKWMTHKLHMPWPYESLPLMRTHITPEGWLRKKKNRGVKLTLYMKELCVCPVGIFTNHFSYY